MTSKKIIRRTKAPTLTTGTRREIKELHQTGMKRNEIAEYIGCTVGQVDAVIYKKVKMKKSDRADKGLSRNKKEKPVELLNGKKTKDQRDIIARLKDALEGAVIDLEVRKMQPDEKITLIEKSTRMVKNLQAMELQTHMKGTNAELIIRIMLRFDPELSIDEIKKIYLEETEKLKNSSE